MEELTETKANERDAQRRATILEAARECFLQFGYAKTSLDDIARRARVSRPLIYTKFKNKEEIFAAVYEQTLAGRYPLAEQVLTQTGAASDKLMRIYEIILLELWEDISTAPMAAEFYEACAQLFPQIEAKYERLRLGLTQAILGDQELAEVFMLAVDGLEADLPSPALLRRRLTLLIERFVQ